MKVNWLGALKALVATSALAILASCGGGGSSDGTTGGGGSTDSVRIGAITPAAGSANVTATQTFAVQYTSSVALSSSTGTFACGTASIPSNSTPTSTQVVFGPASSMPNGTTCTLSVTLRAGTGTDTGSVSFATVATAPYDRDVFMYFGHPIIVVGQSVVEPTNLTHYPGFFGGYLPTGPFLDGHYVVLLDSGADGLKTFTLDINARSVDNYTGPIPPGYEFSKNPTTGAWTVGSLWVNCQRFGLGCNQTPPSQISTAGAWAAAPEGGYNYADSTDNSVLWYVNPPTVTTRIEVFRSPPAIGASIGNGARAKYTGP